MVTHGCAFAIHKYSKKPEKHSPTEDINMQNGDFSELGLCGVHVQGPECPSLQILKAILKWVIFFFNNSPISPPEIFVRREVV